LQARPAHAAAHHFLGATLYQQGKIDDARQEMRRSLELHRGQEQWMENLAALEEHAGNRDVAAQLREAIERRNKGMRETSPSEAAVVV
jgi:Flp pilus assembly protein TadD